MNREQIFQALLIAAIIALVKFIRDVIVLQTQVKPLLEWWAKTSMDALKIATNPTSERLAELADKYIAQVTGKSKERMSATEKQELIDGLRRILHDGEVSAAKRQSASMSLRFIQSCERSQ